MSNYQWWDINSNGEIWIISELQRINKLNTVFDVGANHGEWSEQILSKNPNCNLHCFEICKDIYDKLAKKKEISEWHKTAWNKSNITVNNLGLFDKEKTIDVNYCASNEGLTSMYNIHWSSHWTGHSSGDWAGDREIVKCNVVRGDQYCKEKQISKIDFLKVDTEGSDFFVIKGFGDLLNPSTIGTIQFEYGKANICSRALLIDYYELLEEKGYLIGRLKPNTIEFKEYQYSDENFLEGNFICMSKEIATELKLK